MSLKNINFRTTKQLEILLKDFCKKNGLKLEWLINQAIIHELDARGRYEPKPTKRP